jgi:predicted ATPase
MISSGNLQSSAHVNRNKFVEWLAQEKPQEKPQENQGLYWIKGNPGSGKSILMESCIDRLPDPQRSFNVVYWFPQGEKDRVTKVTVCHMLNTRKTTHGFRICY